MSILSNLNPIVWIREFALTVVLRGIFEKIPVLSNLLSLLEGKKELIGRIGEFLSAILVAFKVVFPEIEVGIDEAMIAYFVSVFIKYIGIAHAYDKDRRGIARGLGAIKTAKILRAQQSKK